MEEFFMMFKPDSYDRPIKGEIISRFEKRDFKLVSIRTLVFTEELFDQHYAEHQGKDFYDKLKSRMINRTVIAMIWFGDVSTARRMVGLTDPFKADQGTIRGDFACNMSQNVIHCSDSLGAKREVELWSKYM